jgi:hypothetical protein
MRVNQGACCGEGNEEKRVSIRAMYHNVPSASAPNTRLESASLIIIPFYNSITNLCKDFIPNQYIMLTTSCYEIFALRAIRMT